MLEIKLLSKFGDVIHYIECEPGTITVLRAAIEKDLIPFRQALFGNVSAKKIVVYYKDEKLDKDEAFRVGLGESIPSGITLYEYLSEEKADLNVIKSILLKLDLFDKRDLMLDTFSECQKRRSHLIKAMLSTKKVVILDSPFEPITSLWKEKTAELLLANAVNRGKIVVVSRLSFRPECWIGCPQVKRVQVGTNIQKTVGFGAEAPCSSDLLRKNKPKSDNESKNQTKEKDGEPRAPLHSSAQTVPNLMRPSVFLKQTGKTKFKNNLRKFYKGVLKRKRPFIGVAILLLAISIYLNKPAPPKEIINSSSHQQTSESEKKTSRSSPTKPAPRFLLDGYPPSLKRAVLSAFSASSKTDFIRRPKKRSSKILSPKEEKRHPLKESLPLSIFKELSQIPPASHSNVSHNQNNISEQTIDEAELRRREEIKRKFLKALQEAGR